MRLTKQAVRLCKDRIQARVKGLGTKSPDDVRKLVLDDLWRSAEPGDLPASDPALYALAARLIIQDEFARLDPSL